MCGLRCMCLLICFAAWLWSKPRGWLGGWDKHLLLGGIECGGLCRVGQKGISPRSYVFHGLVDTASKQANTPPLQLDQVPAPPACIAGPESKTLSLLR